MVQLKTSMLLPVASLMWSSLALATNSSPPEDVVVGQFPDPLTLENFMTRTQHGLHLIEFFSPYCSHCKQFAPTWEKTWEDFHEEGEGLGIDMFQVDCVASGDLCNQEKIRAYPSLKLYGPKGFIKDYPSGYKRNQDSMIRFMRDISIELADPNFLIDSKSKFISTDVMVKILGESQKKPQLISLWPSHDLEDLNQYDKDKFRAALVEDCLDFQRTWSIVSNQVSSLGVETGHFNCLSNKQICSKLEMDLTKPNVLLILPETNIAKVVEFDQTIYDATYKDITAFTKRMVENSKPRQITSFDLVEEGLAKSKLGKLFEFPESSEWNIVYVFDEETTTREDLELLPYLIEPLSKLPHTHLFKSNDSSILSMVDIQKQNIYKRLNQNIEDGQEKRIFNEQRNTIETMTSLPTLVAFKDNMLMPNVFQNFAPNEIRDQYRVIDWLNSLCGSPVYQEITPLTFKKFMEFGETSQKLSILIVDKAEEKEALTYQNNFIVGVHDYNEVRDEVRFRDLLKKRQLKQEEVKVLKEKNAESKLIVRAMSQYIEHNQYPDVVFGYLDIKENLELLNRVGIDVHEREFSNGDVLILERSGNGYYEEAANGELLNVRDSQLLFREALCVVNGVTKGRLARRLRNSPFPSYLRLLEPFHERIGVLGYVFIGLVFIAFHKKGPWTKVFQRLSRQDQHKSRDSLGILGNPAAKFD